MEHFIVSFNAVAPIFCMLALGYFMKWKGLFKGASLEVINSVCFKVFLPILLFYDIYQTELEKVMNPRLILFAVVVVLAEFLVLSVVVPIFEKVPARRGVLIQGIFRSNFVILGIPMSMTVFGPESTGVAAMLIGVVVPMYNVLSVLTLQLHGPEKTSLGSAVRGVMKNPLIISAILALAVLFSGLRFPTFVESTLNSVGSVASPLSIVALGASFQFRKIAGNGPQICAGVFGKLVLIPAFVISSAVLCGFRGVELMVLLTCTGTPTAISSFVMAEQMGGDGDLAGQLVVFSSVLSCGTMFLWIFFLQYFGLM